MAMREAAFLITLILIIGSLPLTAGKGVEKPVQRDVFLYDYFSEVLVHFEYSLKYTLANESYGLKLATQTLNELELINTEAMYYRDRGVDSPVMEVIPPFYDFARELVTLDNMTLEFQRKPTPALAAGITGTIRRMEGDLNKISALRLRNGTKVLAFNTEKVGKYLEAIRKLVSKTGPTGKLMIGISTNSPILHQNVTIFGSCPGNETVTIVIAGKNSTILIPIKPINGLFSTTYSFDRLGTYTVYATQRGNRSNVVTVTVRKIPSLFLAPDAVSALLNQTATISGKLVDYYGKPLGGRNITVGNESLTTNPDGSFSKGYLSPKAIGFRVSLKFDGDSTHSGTTKTVTVKFKRYPVTITLNGPQEITLGKTASFTGNIRPRLSVPISIYVNGKPYLNLTSEEGNFSFTLRPEETGDIEVYAAFPGNEVYGEATSNVLTINVVSPLSRLPRYIETTLIALVFMGGIIILKRKKRHPTRKLEKIREPSPVQGRDEGPTTAAEVEIPKDVGEAYRLLREKLRDRFGVGESLTPREVLGILKGREFYPYLERVTLLHEKAVYGNVPLTKEELAEFIEDVRRIMEGDSR